ncbi:MAG: hypothetical protein U0271_09385 [Polyangiaceae bacterium]
MSSSRIAFETPLRPQLAWGAWGLGLAPILVRILGSLLHVPQPPFWKESVEVSWALCLVAVVAWAALRARGQGASGTLEVEPDALALTMGSTRRRVPRQKIASGVIYQDGAGFGVEFGLPGRVLRVRARDEGAARALLRATGFDAGAHRLTVPAVSAASRIRVGWGLAALAVITIGLPFSLLARFTQLPAWSTWVWVFGSAALAAAVQPLSARGTVSVGLDGVEITGMFRRRFIPYKNVSAAHAAASDLVIELRDDEPLRVHVGDAIQGASPHLARALAERIQEARALAGGVSSPKALLARGGRTVSEWRAALAERVRNAAGYRDAPLDRETLARVLAEPSSGVEQRVGAALALVGSEDPEAPDKIRVALDTTADAAVGRALQAVLDGSLEDAQLEEALAAEESSEVTSNSD